MKITSWQVLLFLASTAVAVFGFLHNAKAKSCLGEKGAYVALQDEYVKALYNLRGPIDEKELAYLRGRMDQACDKQ